jgi:hypothetical protein
MKSCSAVVFKSCSTVFAPKMVEAAVRKVSYKMTVSRMLSFYKEGRRTTMKF